MKIIHIIHHSLSPLSSNVDIKHYEYSWHIITAKQILKQTDKYKIECWSPEKTFKKIYTRHDNKITYKIFPSVYIRFGREYSILLLKELKKELKKDNILIHLHGIHNHLTYLISYIFRNVPIVAQHHGSSPPIFNLKKSKHPLRFLCLLEHYPERIALKNIDHFFVLTKYEKKYLSNLVGSNKVEMQTMGVDFDIFKPTDKEKARIKLNLNNIKNYILYVGHLNKSKGLYYLIKALPRVIEKYPNTVLLLVGKGNYKTDMISLAKNLGILNNIKFLGYIPNNQLPLFYNASDIFILPSLKEGAPVVIIESMACGTPTIGTKVGGIPNIMDNFKNKLLIPPKDHEAISEKLITVLKDLNSFKPDVANGKMNYNWKNITNNTINIYDMLFNKYYIKR